MCHLPCVKIQSRKEVIVPTLNSGLHQKVKRVETCTAWEYYTEKNCFEGFKDL